MAEVPESLRLARSQALQIAEQTPYTPSTPLRRPAPGPSAREAQRRMLLGAPRDIAQAGRNYQQNYVSQLRDGRLPDAVRDLPGQAFELTGLPSFRRAGRAAAEGDAGTAALEAGMGALSAVGMGAAIRPAARPLLGAARAPAGAAAVPAESPQRIPRAIQPQTRASDGTILPAQPRETFGRPFSRTAGTSGDLREAAQPAPLRGGTPEALQRAREQGFDVDTPLYHGTDRSFNEFSLDEVGARLPSDFGEGIYLTRNPDEASVYAGDPLSWLDPNQGITEGANVMPVFARMRNPKIIYTSRPGSLVIGDAAEQARARGHDGIIVRGAKWDAQGRRIPGTEFDVETIVFDPRNIRSRFAAFDPARSGESDLLAITPDVGDADIPRRAGFSPRGGLGGYVNEDRRWSGFGRMSAAPMARIENNGRSYALHAPHGGGEFHSSRAGAVASARAHGWQVPPIPHHGAPEAMQTKLRQRIANQRLHDMTNAEEARLIGLDEGLDAPPPMWGVRDIAGASLRDAMHQGDGRVLREMLDGELGPYSLEGRGARAPLLSFGAPVAAAALFGGRKRRK